ncbi:MAG: XrtA-associated tyrosine autokinase [Pseudomonadota bacterium]
MSKIQDALQKLQRGESAAVQPARPKRQGFPGEGGRTAVPVARKKKVEIEGEKFHIDQHALIKGGLLAPLDQAVPIADEFRKIKRPLLANARQEFSDAAEHMNVIMLASAMPNAGKTFCSVNLAFSISLERELNVVLIDADVAKPHISRAFGLKDKPGLIDLLVDDQIDLSETLVRTDLNGVQVIPAGRGHAQATELLASDRMSEVVDEISTRYADRIVIVDSPPLLVTSEAQALATQVGQVVLVIEAGKTAHQTVQQVLEVLDHQKAINFILNKSRRTASPDYYYGASYGYTNENEES